MVLTVESRRVLAVCVVTVFIGLCDRVQISVAIIHMAQELHWSLSEQGAVLAAFFYGYTLTQVWGASLGANYGPRRVLAAAMFAWSFLTILTPCMARWSFTLAIASRVLLGVFEGVTFPCIFAIISPLVSEADRGGVVAWINVGHCLGTVTAFFLCPILSANYGWPSSFYLFGLLGVGVAATWAEISRRPYLAASKDKPEDNLPRLGGGYDSMNSSISNAVSKRPIAAMVAMLREPAVAAICFSHFCNNYGSFTVLSWLPTIMSERFSVEGTDLSMACLPYIAAMFGALFGGHLSDRFVAAGMIICVLGSTRYARECLQRDPACPCGQCRFCGARSAYSCCSYKPQPNSNFGSFLTKPLA
eukprot:m.109001 g.109001  ORF g.109001 m.109001 type:complete len:360 (+) comp16953_c0_seq2:238-1317(+)